MVKDLLLKEVRKDSFNSCNHTLLYNFYIQTRPKAYLKTYDFFPNEEIYLPFTLFL